MNFSEKECRSSVTSKVKLKYLESYDFFQKKFHTTRVFRFRVINKMVRSSSVYKLEKWKPLYKVFLTIMSIFEDVILQVIFKKSSYKHVSTNRKFNLQRNYIICLVNFIETVENLLSCFDNVIVHFKPILKFSVLFKEFCLKITTLSPTD